MKQGTENHHSNAGLLFRSGCASKQCARQHVARADIVLKRSHMLEGASPELLV